MLLLRVADQHIRRDTKFISNATNHGQGQRTASCHHFRDARAASNEGFEVLSREPLLLHAKLDGGNRIGCIDTMMLRFVGINKSRKDIQFLPLRRVGLGSDEFGNSIHCQIVIGSQFELDESAYRSFSNATFVTSILSYSLCVPSQIISRI